MCSLLLVFCELPNTIMLPLRYMEANALVLSVVVAGIVRTIHLNTVVNETYDVSWAMYPMWIWTVVELYIAIIAASAPALKPFFLVFLVDRIRTWPSRTLGSDSNGAELSQKHNRGTKKRPLVADCNMFGAGPVKSHDQEKDIGITIREDNENRGSQEQYYPRVASPQ